MRAGLLVLVGVVASVRQAHAQASYDSGGSEQSGCGDFGGIGVAFGAGLGLGATAIGAVVYPAVARNANPRLSYWPGVGYTFASGTAAVLLSAAALSENCPQSSVVIPTVITIPVQILTTVIWAELAAPDPGEISLIVARPRSGDGVVLGLGSRF